MTSGFNSKTWKFGPITWMIVFIIIWKLNFLDNNVVFIYKVWYMENKLHFYQIKGICKLLPQLKD